METGVPEAVERESRGTAEEEEDNGSSAMIWSLEEANEKQTSQIGASACGATAVIDVLQALGFNVAAQVVDRCVRTNLRKNEALLPEYLLSRSVAGTTSAQLVASVERLTGGVVVGRLFCLYPERQVDLCRWLCQWIRKGAVPVATMNMQVGVPPGEEIPDAWHHQMVFGVAPDTVYMTNPLEAEKASLVKQRLCSDSVLLVRREDVLMRLSDDTKLSALSQVQDDPRWDQLDVAGQVGQMIYEEITPDEGAATTHLVIPAVYKSGITLFAVKDSELGEELLSAADLPLLHPPH
ncbi:hypothetical protein HHUSO_G28582 [Huso huso]|uniref:Uncharacterized protein n=1 Tax=Huso huso TaxID=61971 RepID=A0ABR0YGY3_HUSHU